MAPIITQRRSTERTAAPSYSRRALSSHNDVSLAIGLTVSLVCFVVILVAVWCLLRRRRIMRLGATPVGLESPVDETFSPVVEICSNSTKSLYKYEGDSSSYYSPLSPVAPLELDAGTPRSDVSPFSQYPPVSNSLSRYTPTNGESSSASKRTSPFSKEYYFTEPDHRSHPINTGFGSAGTGSSRYPRKQDINVQINFVNPRDVEYRPNRVLQAEEHAIYLSSLSLPSRGRPASIYDRPPYYIGMDASNIDTTNKGSQRTSPSPLSDRNSVQRISTLRESLQDLHRLSIIDVPTKPHDGNFLLNLILNTTILLQQIQPHLNNHKPRLLNHPLQHHHLPIHNNNNLALPHQPLHPRIPMPLLPPHLPHPRPTPQPPQPQTQPTLHMHRLHSALWPTSRPGSPPVYQTPGAVPGCGPLLVYG
ncbi:hypothetical protein PtrSN002B_004559 [Pyrenophora tritici-repentis]|nr:hypothetical protein A1F99_017830 [Pyrenophora tritici-repentis]KAI0584136.1 hypothetical protein Alg130_05335 [Pyrenophora tritici-repentis]KAI0609308.1 hypothetical protein TUN205_06450 [Pyrenophora tritici-repentis]KAI0621437.1 hypothetical protein TUN199_06576 [Pyrenophora tritici-repentis]KAI1537056.1 hypothetical protein PtrSN001A_005432 [Pyrenophora tritici-repentis]